MQTFLYIFFQGILIILCFAVGRCFQVLRLVLLLIQCKNIPPIIANPASPVIKYKNILLSKNAANCGRQGKENKQR